MTADSFRFEKIAPTDAQIKSLFALLEHRTHKISHREKPAFDHHEAFVRNHPYRAWYLIFADAQAVGSFYVTDQNTIGLNIEGCEDLALVADILAYVKTSYSPYDAIPSVRNARFAVNVPPSNRFLVTALEHLGAPIAQLTFYAPD